MTHRQSRLGSHSAPRATHLEPTSRAMQHAPSRELVNQPGWALHPSGDVRPLGKIRSPITVIFLSIVTFGVYSVIWQYKTFQELYHWRREGVHSGVALILVFFASLATPFLMSGYTSSMYHEEGLERPFGTTHALWLFLPIIGAFIWFFGVQGRINAFWDMKGQLYE